MRDSFGDMLLESAHSTGTELYYSEKRSLQLSAFKGAVSEFSESRSSGATARVVEGRRLGTAYTERLSPEGLNAAAREAALNASCVDEDEGNALFDGEGKSEAELDAGGANEGLALDAKKRLALELEERCYALDPRVKNVISTGFGNELATRAIANPRGLSRSERRASAYAYVYLTAEEKGHTAIGFWHQVARRASSLSPAEIARKAVETATGLLGAGMPKSGDYRIVLDGEVAGDLVGAFIDATSAEYIQKGRSLLAGKRGQRLGSPLFTLVDDPRAAGCRGLEEGDPSGWEAFDDEGVPAGRLELFSGGVFVEPMYTIYSARREGAAPNGRGFRRTPDSPLFAGTHNALIPAGGATQEELLAAAGTGILVTQIEGLHASLSIASGDFSASAKGFMIENGRRGRPLENFTVAGNFLDFIKAIEGVAGDLRTDTWSALRSPSLLVSSMSVSGD